MPDDDDTRENDASLLTEICHPLRRSKRQTNRQLLLAIGISISAAAVVVAILTHFVDPSQLANLPDDLAVDRDVSYGASEHQCLDIVYEQPVSRVRPAVVMIHQGGWMEGDKSSYPSAASLRSAATKRRKVSSRLGRIGSLFANNLLFTTKARIP